MHHDPHALEGYACAAFAGHDEYWTREMRDHVDAFVEEGGIGK
ncbi:N,N-dimethylformamidase beta subunit family domain-containing protein [Pseudomonas costantinii]